MDVGVYRCVYTYMRAVVAVSENERMRRMQFYIDHGLHESLAQLAQDRGVPMAAIIREALQSLVHAATPQSRQDPALDIIGIINWPESPKDMALHHDKHIYRRDWER